MNWTAVWALLSPIVKEAFKGRFGFSTYFKRNKVITLLVIILLVEFAGFTFMFEQAVAHGTKSKIKDSLIAELTVIKELVPDPMQFYKYHAYDVKTYGVTTR